MTPMKSHSPRANFWISSIRTENGGRRGKVTARLVVCSTTSSLFSSFIDPHFLSLPYIAVAPSNYLRIVGTPASPGPTQSAFGADMSGPQGVSPPLMSTPGNAGIGPGGGPPLPADSSEASNAAYPWRVKALYACAYQNSLAFAFDPEGLP